VSTQKPVIVVGGGVAGLASAVHLASRNVPVLLLEQRPRPGGRTYSFSDTASGEIIDNGQHLLIAGYRRTFDFLATIGALHLLDVQRHPVLLFHHPVRGFQQLALPGLVAPFHILCGVLRFGALSGADRVRLLRAGPALQGPPARFADLTVAEWLAAARQSAETARCFWDPLTIAIMNEVPERAAAVPFVRALQTAFLGSANGAALAIPSVGLTELLVDPALGYLGTRGAMVQCGADVERILIDGSGAHGVQLRSGGTLAGSAVILAVPWHSADVLLQGIQPLNPRWQTAETTPIVSVHLWFTEDFMPDTLVGLIGRRVQWIFNRRRINREPLPGGHCSVVISAARKLVDLSNEELLSLAAEDICSVYPRCPAHPVRGVVIREKRATPSLTPELDRVRPGAATAVPGLFLAGDWTDTGLPATVEGAVQSGERCATLVLETIPYIAS
jgi:hydroxysqualene dehydroxylase